MKRLASALAVLTLPLAQPALALPITIDYAGFFLDTIGLNTIGIAGGGTAAGTHSTLFVAKTTPDYYGGTSASVFQNGAYIGTLGLSNFTGLEWARRTINPTAAQLKPLTVAFVNGADNAQFNGRDLTGLSAMPLVQDLGVDGSSDPFHPTVSWTLPGGAGDIDMVQIAFFDNVNNVEIGSRVNLSAGATSYTLLATVPASYDLTINVRLIDFYDDSLPYSVVTNNQRMSRAYVNYLAPVPEPATWLMLASGGAMLAARRRQRPGC